MNKINNNLILSSLILLAIMLMGVISLTLLPNEAKAEEFGVYHGYTEPQEKTNPTPTIHSLSPNPVILGEGTKTIIINGEGFVEGAVVKLNGSDRTTTFISSTRLGIQLVGDDISYAGNSNISVYNPGPGGGLSNRYTLSVSRKLDNVSASTGSQSSVPSNAGNTSSNRGKTTTTTRNTNTSGSTNTLTNTENEDLGQLAAGAIFGEIGFLPSGIIQWIIFAILVLMLVIIARKLFGEDKYHSTPLKHA